MVKTSMLITVSDELNNFVVSPHKKNNTFSKLVTTLLEGYMNDSYIQAYAEGTLVESRQKSLNDLDNTLANMTSSLASLGVYTSDMKSSTEGGLRYFNEYSNHAKESIKDTEDFEEVVKQQKEETEDLKSTVNELKEQNKKILEMMEKLMSGDSVLKIEKTVNEESEPIKKEVSVPEEKIEEVQQETVEVKEPLIKEEPKVEIPVTNDLMSGFLMGNLYSV